MTDCPSFLRVAVNPMKYLRIQRDRDGSVKLFGTEGRFLTTVLEAMKMSFQIVIAEDREWGRLLPNGNWTGLIGKIQKGAADIAAGYVSMTDERATVVDFSPIYLYEEMTFAIEKPGPVPTYLAFLYPFDSVTWILILSVLFVMPLILQCFFHYKETYALLFLRILGFICGQHTLRNDNITKLKTFMTSLLFFTTIISFSYSNVLLSMLSIPSETIPVQNFKELANAVKNEGYNFFIQEGSSPLFSMLHSDKEHFRYLGETAIRHGWYSNHRPIIFSDQIGKRTALTGIRGQLEITAGPEHWKPHYLSGDSIGSYLTAIAMKKNFCYKKRLKKIITSINNAGLYKQMAREEHFKAWLTASEKRRDVSNKINSLALEYLSGVFGILLIGLSLSIITFIFEVMRY